MTGDLSEQLEKGLATFVRLTEENPYTGTPEQIVTLCLGIDAAATRLKRSTFSLFREETGINDKVFSKLRVIGKTLKQLSDKERRDVVNGLPASYSTIHVLCSISPAELVTGIRSKNISPATTVGAARAYAKQVRFPALAAADGGKGRWGAKQEHLWSVFRPEETPLAGEASKALEEALRRVCQQHGVVLRQATTAGIASLREEERGKRAAFWREVLEGELTHKWFLQLPEDVKKQFNLKTIDELRDTPLRQFTGFLIKADGGRGKFWETHGEAYVSKVQYLMESTEDRAQRFNLKRRLEEVLGDRRELAIWNNTVLKRSGLL